MTQPSTPDSNPLDYELPPTKSGKGRKILVFVLILAAAGIFFYQRMGGVYLFSKPDHIAWQADFQSALAKSKETGKPVLVDFGASWCPACQQMKHQSWPDEKVQRLVVDKYIPVFLDVDVQGAGEISHQYVVEYLPTVLILNGDGKVLNRAEYMDAGELAEFLNTGKAPVRQPS